VKRIDVDWRKLLAAAPDLLAACIAAVEEDSGMMCTPQLRAAIHKVTGLMPTPGGLLLDESGEPVQFVVRRRTR